MWALRVVVLDVGREHALEVTSVHDQEPVEALAAGSTDRSFGAHATVPELPKLAERLLAAYQSEAYKEHKQFEFIDFLRPEKNPAVTAELEMLLIEALHSQKLVDIHLAAPEPLDWSDMNGFRFSSQGSASAIESDPRITTYLGTKADSVVTGATLRNDKMLAIGASNNHEQNSWPIFRCLVYQIEHEGDLYVLSGGDWFRVNLEFKERVYEDVRQLASEMAGLPGADHGTNEADYNTKAASALDALCLDKKLVSDGGPDSIEICDILTRTGGFIHVKHRGSSSTLSHLFAQGLISAERLLEDSEFRRKAREIAAAANHEFAEVITEARPNAADHEITFVVITRSDRLTPLTLPFFSVVNLRAAMIRLRAMGFQVSVASVRESADAA